MLNRVALPELKRGGVSTNSRRNGLDGLGPGEGGILVAVRRSRGRCEVIPTWRFQAYGEVRGYKAAGKLCHSGGGSRRFGTEAQAVH